MRLTGFCERCHRIRRVRVNFGRWTGRGVPVGICDDCDAKR
jgi:hypothetical protein